MSLHAKAAKRRKKAILDGIIEQFAKDMALGTKYIQENGMTPKQAVEKILEDKKKAEKNENEKENLREK